MKRIHPVWRGFCLAAGVGMLVAASGEASAAGVIAGALAASLPGRIRRRTRRKTTLRSCGAGLLGGLGTTLGLGLAGGGVLAGLCQGSVSAVAFAACAWLSGGLALRLWERRHA